jgi:hypothetical protein
MSATPAPVQTPFTLSPSGVLTSPPWLAFFDAMSKSGHVVVTNQTLTADTTISSPGTPTDGATWKARIDQDDPGGHAVTWGAGIANGPQIDSTVNADKLTMSIITFSGIAGYWTCSTLPVFGRPIPPPLPRT